MDEMKRKRLSAAIIILCVVIIFISLEYYRTRLENDYKEEPTFTLSIGDTVFVLNETGVLYNGSFYLYDDIFSNIQQRV